MSEYRIQNGQLIPKTGSVSQNKVNSQDQTTKSQTSFQEILEKSIKEKEQIKFSYHAQQRLDQRNITLTDLDMDALKGAMEKAEQKGARESLLLYKDMAFITSIKNRTIITAIDAKSTEENVFTNIDSAVIVDKK